MADKIDKPLEISVEKQVKCDETATAQAAAGR